MGAILNVQLDRIEGIIGAMRRERDTILEGIKELASLGLRRAPLNSREFDCATNVFLTLPSAAAALAFTETYPSVIAAKTGRHTYTEWDQVLMGAGAAHPLMNPYTMPANAECRKAYSKDMCARSLEILNRTILVPTHRSTRRRTLRTSFTTSRRPPAWRSAVSDGKRRAFARPRQWMRRNTI